MMALLHRLMTEDASLRHWPISSISGLVSCCRWAVVYDLLTWRCDGPQRTLAPLLLNVRGSHPVKCLV